MSMSAEVIREIKSVVQETLAHPPVVPKEFPYYVSANKDQIQRTGYYKEFRWGQSYTRDGRIVGNQIQVGFDTKAEGEALIERLRNCRLVWLRNWTNP